MSKRILSLRGRVTCVDNADSFDNEIFLYEANDLTRGWVVTGAYIWPSTTRAATGSTTGEIQVNATIATDTAGQLAATSYDLISNADDNRQIGWCNVGYQLRSAGAVSDYISNGKSRFGPTPFTIDPQHVVANGLYLNMYTQSDSSTSPTREWNYMVILEPKKMDPKETILHLLKTVAQDGTS